ncbi:PilT protein domain protein [Xylanimonas cellulosilytica DSM 15894]|uniref:PilT protein domain protein n=1 Tax=Xylanimonas cellulosilytica (strain DSM 15894 / JCM 12276 / CECT 5975 / KCTC 9989 / LMG 20990 / NBRC 107835 / XIL07) TaxID=446471 RepID=D1BUJ6_XYLCX|nr:type II toxin-antitoxin system VapC family toxin [Xylanimonas cellulosilytica]ACZ29237.1 PilT protein domain protein [Xylanimonas cellulosilytica DSM 15894]
MRLLIDTHILLWLADDDPRLPARGRELLADPAAQIVFSAASIWEVAIKAGLDRSDFTKDPFALRSTAIAAGLEELPVTGDHAARVAALPAIHSDPFDRILVAQATAESITLVTHDETVSRYPGPIVLV